MKKSLALLALLSSTANADAQQSSPSQISNNLDQILSDDAPRNSMNPNTIRTQMQSIASSSLPYFIGSGCPSIGYTSLSRCLDTSVTPNVIRAFDGSHWVPESTLSTSAQALTPLGPGRAPVALSSKIEPLPHVANLSALTTWPYKTLPVVRDGYAAPGDGGTATYNFLSSACTITGGDGGSQISAVGGGCWVIDPAQVITPRIFGAKCDGDTSGDDTIPFNVALSVLGTRQITDLRIPGKCVVSGPLIAPNSGTIEAAAYSGNGIITKSATGDVIFSTGNFFAIRGLTFNTTVKRTGGAYVKFAPAFTGTSGRIEFAENTIFDPYNGIDLEAGASVVHLTHNRAFYYGQTAAPNGALILLNTQTGNADQNIEWMDAFASPTNRPSYGVLIKGGGDVAISHSNFDQFVKPLYAHICAGSLLVSLRSNNTYYDSAGQNGVDLFADGTCGSGATPYIARADFVQSWTSSAIGGDGFVARTARGGAINGLDLVQHHAFGNGANGVDFADGGVSNAHVLGGEFAGNASCGVNNGPNSGFSMIGATSGATGGFGANSYGVCVFTGATNFRVGLNDLRNNTTAPASISPTQSASEIVSDNVGYLSSYVSQTISTALFNTDATHSVVGIESRTTFTIPTGSGELTVSDDATHSVAKFLVGSGAVTLVGQAGTAFVSGPPAAGKIGIIYDGTNYQISNNTAAVAKVAINSVRMNATN